MMSLSLLVTGICGCVLADANAGPISAINSGSCSEPLPAELREGLVDSSTVTGTGGTERAGMHADPSLPATGAWEEAAPGGSLVSSNERCDIT